MFTSGSPDNLNSVKTLGLKSISSQDSELPAGAAAKLSSTVSAFPSLAIPCDQCKEQHDSNNSTQLWGSCVHIHITINHTRHLLQNSVYTCPPKKSVTTCYLIEHISVTMYCFRYNRIMSTLRHSCAMLQHLEP